MPRWFHALGFSVLLIGCSSVPVSSPSTASVPTSSGIPAASATVVPCPEGTARPTPRWSNIMGWQLLHELHRGSSDRRFEYEITKQGDRLVCPSKPDCQATEVCDEECADYRACTSPHDKQR